MTPEEMEPFHRKLVALHERLRRDTSAVTEEALRTAGGEASGSLSNAPLHPADLGTDNFEQEVSLWLLENQEQLLEQSLAALDRINTGTYGRCQECGAEIPPERLKAVPYSPYCLACASQFQTAGGEGRLPGKL